jgi:hypothetical protein
MQYKIFKRGSLACAKDLIGLYTIKTLVTIFKNALRAHRQMCTRGSLTKEGKNMINKYIIFFLLAEGADHKKLPSGQFLAGARMRNGTWPEAPG